MIPQSDKDGALPPGIHLATVGEVIRRFCFNSMRQRFAWSLQQLESWALARGASRVFIGGSFLSDKGAPSDLDCLVVFRKDSMIPHRSERATINAVTVDVQFCSQEHPELVDTFLAMFQENWRGRAVGIVEIPMSKEEGAYNPTHSPNEEELAIVRATYGDRSFIDNYRQNGILVTIHGILTNAGWNAHLAPASSSQGWIFAPFLYTDMNDPRLLVDRSRAREVVDRFREWIYDIYSRYQMPISIISHSFGTYVACSYITGMDKLPVPINCLIMTGSIITSEYDWAPLRGRKLARILNEIAPNDEWVKYMPVVKWLIDDPLYGNAGTVGFKKPCPILTQRTTEIFDHNNVIKRDVIESYWLPYLLANRSAWPNEKLEADCPR